jgi:antitoxin ParD1/3/4
VSSGLNLFILLMSGGKKFPPLSIGSNKIDGRHSMAAKKVGITIHQKIAALDGPCALLKRDAAVESWLQDRVAKAYDGLKADPASALSGDDIREHLCSLIARRR